LYQALRTRGFDVWWDRVSMPSRLLTFHQEIRDAIAARQRLVLVIGPRAISSDYVYQEWQFALQGDKVVTPILRLGDYEDVPDELKLLHIEDFREDARFPFHLDNLARQLSELPPPLGKLIAVPSLPAHYLARAERLHALRDALRADLDRPVVIGGASARVGVHGMGGIGKSVLAAALARDRKIREAFPDGLIWIGLGSLPDVPALQRRLHKDLGGDGAFATAHEGKEALKKLLADKAVLLILDDAWRRADVDDFDVFGPRCRGLITTRDTGLLTSLGGVHHVVELLTDNEAYSLLAQEAGLPREELPTEAEPIVRECGRLPLALALCGGLVRRGLPWSSVLEQLQQARIERIADRHAVEPHHQSVWHAIHVSVQFLAADERARFLELAVFPPDETAPEAAISTLWAHTGGLDDWQAQELLVRLGELSLVQLVTRASDSGQLPRRQVALHDLIYDYVRRAGSDTKALQDQLLAAYGAKCKNGWPSGPNDGYFFTHLCRHLIAADRLAELAGLLHDLRWLETKTEAGLVFDLANDYREAVATLPEENGQRRLLRLLEEALRRDFHFIARHPTTLFQCLWNSCWWYDAPETARHYVSPKDQGNGPATLPWRQPGPKLHRLMELWRDSRGNRSAWRRCLRQLSRTILQIPSWITGITVGALAGLLVLAVKGWLGDIFASVASAAVALAHLQSSPKVPRWTISTASVAAGLAVFVTLEWLTGVLPWVVPWLRCLAYIYLLNDKLVTVWMRNAYQRLVFEWRIAVLKRQESRGCYRWLRALRPPQVMLGVGGFTTMTGHQGDVISVAVAPDGACAASISSDDMVLVWDLPSGEEHSRFAVPPSLDPYWLAFMSDSRRVLVAGTQSALECDIDTEAVVRHVEFSEAEEAPVQFIADGQAVISGDGQSALLLDRNGSLVGKSRLPGLDKISTWFDSSGIGPPNLVAVSPDGAKLATHHYQAGSGGDPKTSTLRLWDAASDSPLAELVLEDAEYLRALRVARSGIVAACEFLRKVLVWEATGNRRRVRWFTHPRGEGLPLLDRVLDFAFSLERGLLAAGFNDGSVVVWEVESGRVVADEQMHGRRVRCLSFTPDGNGIISGADDRAVVLRQLGTAANRLKLRGSAEPIIRIGWFKDFLIFPTGWLNDLLIFVDDSGGQRTVHHLMTGECVGVTHYERDQWAFALAFLHRPPTEDLARMLRHHGPALPETVVQRSSGEKVGLLPGLFGVTNIEGLPGSGGTLKAHASGYYWVGYQGSYLSMFQLECD
jgi:WD40 repeat protein